MLKNNHPYDVLIQSLKQMPLVAPSAGFTEQIMGQLPEIKRDSWHTTKKFFLEPMSAGAFWSFQSQGHDMSKEPEGSFYFFVSGFFYLLMALLLSAGLYKIDSEWGGTYWFVIQLPLTLGTAIWLLAIAFLLARKGRLSIKMAKYGTVLYVLVSVVNGILLRPILSFPYADLFIFGFIGAGVCMGSMLVMALKQMELRTS